MCIDNKINHISFPSPSTHQMQVKVYFFRVMNEHSVKLGEAWRRYTA